MATRYYPTSRSPGVDYVAPVHGPWDDTEWGKRLHGRRTWSWLLSTSKVDGGARRGVVGAPAWIVGETNDTPNWDVLFARWVTPPLEAQSIGGSLDLVLCAAMTQDGSDAVWKIYAYITVGDTDQVRHVLLDYTDTTLWGIVRVGRSLVAPQGLTIGACQAGDHVVVELGVRFANAVPADDILVFDTVAAIEFGTQDGTAGAPLADATLGGAGGAGYLDFTHTFVEQAAPAPPAHDACADAVVIAALPYSDGPVDTTQSADTNRAVWYTWTADSADEVLVRTWGSNYRVQIDIYSGGCGGLVFVAGNARQQWIQGSQAVCAFTPTPGVQYWIRLTSATATVESAQNSGGALHLTVTKYAVPIDDDLFVNCQHLTCWRGGTLINFNDGFFGNTPTGAAIDYTERPIPDLNGGTHTGERVVCTLFDFALVEFVDLPTLNRGESEVTFIAIDDCGEDALCVPAESFLSSIVFDRAGEIVLGFFGDGYDVIGTLSTPATMYPRRLDPTVNFSTTPELDILDFYEVAQDVMGSDYVEISADQTTLFYTSAGQRVLRFDMDAKVQLADYALVPVAPGPRPGLRGGRLLPPGDGSGGMLVTNGSEVVRLNAAGVVIQTYAPAASERAQDLDKVELTKDATKFWVSDQLSCSLFQFDLATGAELADVETGLPAGQLCGFTIYNGFRAGLEEPPGGGNGGGPPPEPPPGNAEGCPTPDLTGTGGGGCGSPVAFFP